MIGKFIVAGLPSVYSASFMRRALCVRDDFVDETTIQGEVQ